MQKDNQRDAGETPPIKVVDHGYIPFWMVIMFILMGFALGMCFGGMGVKYGWWS